MKPDSSSPPLYPDAIPLWLHPDLFDETKVVRHRGWKFVGLYLLSMLLNGLVICGPMAISAGSEGFLTILLFWLVICVPSGVANGLLVWRDFNREVRKLKALE